jgi:hypothetical protein
MQTMKISTKEGFEALPLEANLKSAGDLDKIVQGDMKSEGGMSNLDNMDGTGTGPDVKVEPEVKADAKPYPTTGKPEAAFGKPEAAFGKPDGSLFKAQAFGSGGPIPDLPDMTLGVVPISEQGGEHGYPKQTHGVRIFKGQPKGEHGDVNDPNTYSYLDDIVSNGHVKR